MPLDRHLVDIIRPFDVGSLGSYQVAAQTGTIGANVGPLTPWFSFRWTNAANLAVVRTVQVTFQSVAGFTAGNGLFDMIVARSFSASDTGGVAVSLAGSAQKMRTSMGTSLVGDMRISTTATLVAGTRTLDANPIASVPCSANTSASATQLPFTSLFETPPGQYPLVLAQNEGFILRATVPTTGTWIASLHLVWDEVSGLPF